MKYAWEVFYLYNGVMISEIVYTKTLEMPPLRIPSTFRREDLDSRGTFVVTKVDLVTKTVTLQSVED